MVTERIGNTSTLPFRFADGATVRDSESGSGDMRGMADPADATPEIYLDPNDPSLGEYGREWQAQIAKLGVERSRRMGNPAAANVGRTVMAAWGAEDERRLGTPHLATALSNMVSMEGDAYYAVEDFLADVKSKHKDRREEHYQAAETFEKKGNKEAAAFHRRAAKEWNERR